MPSYQQRYESTCDNSLFAKNGSLLIGGSYGYRYNAWSILNLWFGMNEFCCEQVMNVSGYGADGVPTTDCSRDCMQDTPVCSWY